MQKLNTIFPTKTLPMQTMMNCHSKCNNCNRTLQFKDDKEFCFYCEVIAKEDEQFAKAALKEREEAKKAKVFNFFQAQSLISPALKDATFENYQPTTEEFKRAKVLIQRYATNFKIDKPINLLLSGSYGTGKSHLSVAVTKELMEKGHNCIFISVPKLLTKLKATYNKESHTSEDKLLTALETCDCLVLDDLGAENENEWSTSKLFEIVDNRAGKHTIYTTNLNENDIAAKVGDRNFSRLMYNTHKIEMKGPDYRLKR